MQYIAVLKHLHFFTFFCTQEQVTGKISIAMRLTGIICSNKRRAKYVSLIHYCVVLIMFMPYALLNFQFVSSLSKELNHIWSV